MIAHERLVNQNWWFTTLLIKEHRYCPPLTGAIKCDVLIVGGGFSGISAAAEFLRKGLSVVLIEKNIVGGSSSGRSAGFLTPDSELELHQLVRRYGSKAAGEIWEAPCRGIERLVDPFRGDRGGDRGDRPDRGERDDRLRPVRENKPTESEGEPA